MDVLDKKSGAVILVDGRPAGSGGRVLLSLNSPSYMYMYNVVQAQAECLVYWTSVTSMNSILKSLSDETSSLYWALHM